MTKTNTISWRIYYEDTDTGGVVYYANYLKYCERGRTEFLRDLGFDQYRLMQQNIVFAVKNANIDYKRPARLDDTIKINTRIITLKKASIVFKHTLMRDNDIICQAQIVVVCLKAKEFTPTAIPLSIMSQLTE